jgi:tetratricopeptide (TPR) repeat protein
MALLYGPTPVAKALERLDEIERQTEGAVRLLVQILRSRAGLMALRGAFDEARKLIATADETAKELGLENLRAAGILRMAGEIELAAGDAEAAERALAEACKSLERAEDWGHLASVAPLLARALLVQGRADEAERPLELTSQWIIEDDTDAQILFHRARAQLAALRGDGAAAEALARLAVERAAQGDELNAHANALVDHAEALELNGRRDEATAALGEALLLYERKGNTVGAERMRQRLSGN